MKLTLKAKEQTFKDFVLESASKQIELLKSDIDTFKKMYHSEMTPRETMYLDEAIAEKKKQLSNQQALLRKYQKIRSSATAEEIKAATQVADDRIELSNCDLSFYGIVDTDYRTKAAKALVKSGSGTPAWFQGQTEADEKQLDTMQKELMSVLKKNADALDKDIEKFVKKYKLTRRK